MNGKSTQSKVGLLTEIVRNGQLAWRLLTDRRVGLGLKMLIPGLMGAYLLWPADLLTDVIPVVGQLDDLAILALGIKLFIELCPKDVVRAYRNDFTGGDAPSGGSRGAETVDAEYRVVD